MSPLLLVDFDQTITTKDTIALLGQFGLSLKQNKPWSFFVDNYLQDYNKVSIPDTHTDFRSYAASLDSYRPVEKASLERVSQYKVFEGLTRQQLFDQGAEHSKEYLRPHVIETLQQHRDHVRIVSLNWSKDWIQGFLSELDIPKEHIYSNELTFSNEGKCTGDIVPTILTAGDKQRVIETFKQGRRVIYIGDSLGDIEALVEADMGIIIGNNASLLSSLKTFGYHSLHRVDDWYQIQQLLEHK
ncbi:HAD-like domain-containing protein [Gilbertella persicaria]|uniref:HAD-like domain-containing protein n=1 Tax=Gilbertella persicaria TaxID=101096 RepID=UPI00221F4259|nr:HAD-like domain-containing protein [Gilbertella persicaria]KAI8098431.1 HAD-like domain-containing protein [Gilbertella persicaria]